MTTLAAVVNRPGFDGGSGYATADQGVGGLTVVLFELDRRALPDGVVDPGRVEPVDPAGGLLFDLASAGPARRRSWPISSVLYRPIVGSMRALSRASPTVPTEGAIPASRSASVKVSAVY